MVCRSLARAVLSLATSGPALAQGSDRPLLGLSRALNLLGGPDVQAERGPPRRQVSVQPRPAARVAPEANEWSDRVVDTGVPSG